ncbi:hypothetical protein CQW23_28579 [Capsicum baccatum]|uniref:Uncharacterized protein n=1 Tax=Capsicum baccatum TaxID=33114 RepID=A0A2G2VGZ5_CAPBA|nr:hypothetical protein CQW23_28579 [Capsicum baccatum]
MKYTFDEIKATTKNFSKVNIVGTRGYENVYKGVLPGGIKVALKSFGVVLLELINGRKAIIEFKDWQPNYVTYWAWSLIWEGRALDVLEDNILYFIPPRIMEKYILVVVLYSHLQLYARPIINQVENMLETKIPIPTILERIISLIADLDYIKRFVSSSGGSGNLSNAAGY